MLEIKSFQKGKKLVLHVSKPAVNNLFSHVDKQLESKSERKESFWSVF